MRVRLPLARCLVALLVAVPGVALADPPAAPVAQKPEHHHGGRGRHHGAAGTPALPAAKPQLPAAGAAPSTPAPKAAAAPASRKNKKKAEAPITGPVATYPGFRMLDGGGSRVFVTLSAKVTVTETKSEGKLTYRIAGVQVPTKTNRLPLLTSFFSTPVARAELVEGDKGADLVIEVKDKATAQYRVIENDKGAELQVDFAKVAGETKDEKEDKDAAAPASAARPSSTKSLDSKAGTAY